MYLMQVSVIEVGGEQIGVARLGAAVAADVEVPAFLGGDDAEVLALRLGTFADAAGDGGLDLVRRTNALVAVLDADREADGILHAVATPRRADAALDRPQCLAVGVAALEAGVDQFFPDVRQLMHRRAEQVDALSAGDLRVQTVLLRHLAQDDELVRRDFAARHARHHGVSAAALDVGQEAIVGVLNASSARRCCRSTELARIEATAGLQISQPWPRPWRGSTRRTCVMRLILTISNNSWREQAKCSQRALLTFLPDALIAALNRSVTSGRQPPQPVPAFVQSLISSTEVKFLSRMASQIWPLLTLLHEQICVSLAMPVSAAPAALPLFLPSSSSLGGIASGSLLLASIDSCPYSEASPTRMPPSKCVPSRLNNSFLYEPWKGSSKVIGRAVLSSAKRCRSWPRPRPSASAWWTGRRP